MIRTHRLLVLSLSCTSLGLSACGGEDNTNGGTGASTSTTAGAGGSANGGSANGGSANGGSASGGEGGAAPALPTPKAEFVPSPVGACDELANGDGTTESWITVRPAGIPERRVRVFMTDAARAEPGPVVFYWHGTGSNPAEAAAGLPMDEILAEGGIVLAPAADPAAGVFPWFLTANAAAQLDDMFVADEALACAIEKVGVDLRRIHVAGMSAGGLQTVQMSYKRSGYVASVVPYSGGLAGPPTPQDPENKFSAMIFHGGPDDIVILHFQDFSEAYWTEMNAAGQYAFICNHMSNHTLPVLASTSPTDINSRVWHFMKDHPFGVPSPYVGGLPPYAPDYCTAQP